MTTSTKTRQRTRKQHSNNGQLQEFVTKHNSMKLLGEVVAWSTGKTSHKFADVVQGLKDAALDEKVARAMQPRHAFTRACRKLTEERVIDILREEGDEVIFQFTKKTMESKEWKYKTETMLTLNKITGKVKCEIDTLEATAQAELDKHMEERTTADITKMIQKLFDAEADLFPIRDQGGVYFVPQFHSAFSDKVESFVSKLGGRMIRFPVPAETKNGDKSVQDAVVNGMQLLIAEHEESINQFGLDTRHDTIERQAEKIKQTKVKMQAYASYLQDRKEELEEALTEANRKLLAKVEHLTEERAKSPVVETEGGGNRAYIFGWSVTAVIRWMGKQEWKFKVTRLVIDSFLGLDEAKQPKISDATLRAQLLGGRNDSRGDPANLSAEQIKQLNERKEQAEKAIEAANNKKGE